MRNLPLKDKLLPVRNCERYKMLSCDSVINIAKRNMTGPETSDYNYGTEHSSLELQWLPVHSNFMQKNRAIYMWGKVLVSKAYSEMNSSSDMQKYFGSLHPKQQILKG